MEEVKVSPADQMKEFSVLLLTINLQTLPFLDSDLHLFMFRLDMMWKDS